LRIRHGFRAQELNRLRLLVIEHRADFKEAWHAYLAVKFDASAIDVQTDASLLRVTLADGS